MDLDRKLLVGIEQFDKKRKSLALGKVAKNFAPVILPEFVQSFSAERPMQDNALSFRTIGNFPRFADLHGRWQPLAVKIFETPAAPDSLHKNGGELQRCGQEVGAHAWCHPRKAIAFCNRKTGGSRDELCTNTAHLDCAPRP